MYIVTPRLFCVVVVVVVVVWVVVMVWVVGGGWVGGDGVGGSGGGGRSRCGGNVWGLLMVVFGMVMVLVRRRGRVGGGRGAHVLWLPGGSDLVWGGGPGTGEPLPQRRIPT